MQNDSEMVFTSDCVINLDDLPPLEDYQDLIRTLKKELPNLGLQTLKRFCSSDIQDLIRQPDSYPVLNTLLSCLNKDSKEAPRVLAMLFQLAEIYMFNEDVPSQTVRSFLSALGKHMESSVHRMLIVFLKRISAKIVYVQEEKLSLLMGFLRLSVDRECPLDQSDNIVLAIDGLLRRKSFRDSLKSTLQGKEQVVCTESQMLLKQKCMAYYSKVDPDLVKSYKNQAFKSILQQLLKNEF